ncbi:3-deoxy-7-phosphoheptulonate synthase [Actinoplanes xinjiangensis]|uniref:Phospho-2-dehydro-3-deoxyheptonate aldolase n=1 Tax=Actinoplanes xinjiangensis TaxID=512350 RepID=A0A316EUY1_9ACTN|nr:3-deoxy-7-phosphoheptulonate synthase [Actinoplanes xinjiangensis]PWK36036.1 3-deoxy-D-arabinoheptulosonate-7-phosphate synthase [Actinoplanes xinjiangensis]GIF42965.1 phospho-2-dehydro-3-deoxyheptonate aldolase [Actinoplanes xinjiangensis]
MQSAGIIGDFAEPRPWKHLPAEQQPDWRAHAAYDEACRSLAEAEPLATHVEIGRLRQSLSTVTTSGTLVLQSGDCAESFSECTDAHIADKLRVLDQLADRFSDLTGSPVIRIGRMAGQFAKPRSQATEIHGDQVIGSFRGHMVNSEAAAPAARAADPQRMWRAYQASSKVQRAIRNHRRRPGVPAGGGPWSSHEALILDYETRLLRRDLITGGLCLTSTHLPWVGERTRDPRGAHVALLSAIANPIGCKLGPTATPDEVLALCRALDPHHEPGRLTLIPRMGRHQIRDVLPPIVRAVTSAGYPVVWLCDPMHGNTVVSRRAGLKTRYLVDIITESLTFRDILDGHGQHAAGLHLEVAAGDVTECVGGPVPDEDRLSHRFTSLCDPRLNPEQAIELVEAWAKGVAAPA